MDKTHYRKAFNSPYLSSADVTDPMVLTISYVKLEIDKSKKTKDSFNTAYFTKKEIRSGELLKPMILNVGNCEIIKGFANSKFIDDWQNIDVTIYVDANVKFGKEIKEGLRISPRQPVKRELIPNTKQWENAIKACKRDGNIYAVKSKMTISPENEKLLMDAANVS